MREDEILHSLPHGSRYVIVPGDFPKGEPGTLEYRRQLIAWTQADPDRADLHRRRPLRIKTTDTVDRVVKKLEMMLEREKLIDEYFSLSSTVQYAKPGETPILRTSVWSEIGFRWVAVYPVTGSNEGVYIHVELVGCKADQHSRTERGRYPIATGKTWTWENAWKITRRCTELLGA